MVNAVIFDMDGVMIDSEGENLKPIWTYAQTCNPEVKIEQLYGMIGKTGKDTWEVLAKAIGKGQSWEQVQAECDPYEKSYVIDYQQIYRRELTAVLQLLKQSGIKVAVASSSRMKIIQEVLEINQIAGYFQAVVSGESFKRSKPDPEIYHYTAAQLKVNESDCLVIEDSEVGIRAAKRAGMKVVAYIEERYGLDQSEADYYIPSFARLPELIN